MLSHPTPDDVVTTEGLLHIATCGRCLQIHGEYIVAYAKSVHQVMARYAEAMEPEQKTGI